MTAAAKPDWAYDDGFVLTGLRGPEVCRLAGISYRQLDYWARTGLIWSSLADAKGSGSQRRWSREDVAYIRLIRELRDLGVTLERIRGIARPLRLSIDTRDAKPYLVVTTQTAYAADAVALIDAVGKNLSTVVLNLDEVCALGPERDTRPAATGRVRKTSTAVSSGATAGL